MASAEMRAQGTRRIHAQQVALRARQQLKNWTEVLKLVKTREALHPAVAVHLRERAGDEDVCEQNGTSAICSRAAPAH